MSAGRSTFRKQLVDILKHLLYDSAVEPFLFTNSPGTVALEHATANKALSIFSFELRSALLGNFVHNTSNTNTAPTPRTLLQPPSTLDIPFLSFMDLPLPFSPNVAKIFGTCHLHTMTSPEFLEDGEWAGYYCFSIPRADNVHFDPPMSRIRFVTSRHSADSRTLGLSADGIDSVGSFHLQGEINSETGRVIIRKEYNHGVPWAWDWFSIMTPFGIVGSWGRQDWGGWFWLWKTSWSGGDQGSS
jgi:hypothetical protein